MKYGISASQSMAGANTEKMTVGLQCNTSGHPNAQRAASMKLRHAYVIPGYMDQICWRHSGGWRHSGSAKLVSMLKSAGGILTGSRNSAGDCSKLWISPHLSSWRHSGSLGSRTTKQVRMAIWNFPKSCQSGQNSLQSKPFWQFHIPR